MKREPYDFSHVRFRSALKRYIKTDSDMHIVNEDGVIIDVIDPDGEATWVYLDGGNPYYNSDSDSVEHLSVEAYKYDMSLYGRDELQILKKSWIGAATQIFKDAFVRSGTTIDDYVYNDWDDLTDDQKEDFSGESDYEEKLSDYLDYTSKTARVNKMINEGRYGKTYGADKTDQTKGVIYMAQDEIDKCETLISALENHQQTYYNMRKAISDSVTFEQFPGKVSGAFTNTELGIINTLIREADYSNENILITNLDSLGRSQDGNETVVDVQKELLADAEKKLFEKSRPQYSFTADIDNLLALPEFSAPSSSIQLLNYIYLRIGLYDNETVRLRIISIENNPIIDTEELTLEFSNMTYTYDGLSDLIHLFEDIAGGSSSGGSSSSGSGGTYGTNDAEITISNNMLNALLKNRDYISSVNQNILQTQNIITNELNAGKIVVGGYATKSGLATNNYTEINGGNITTGQIQSYDGNTWLNLDGNAFHYGGNNGYIDWNNMGEDALYISGNLAGSDALLLNGIPVAGLKNFQLPGMSYYSFVVDINYSYILYPTYLVFIIEITNNDPGSGAIVNPYLTEGWNLYTLHDGLNGPDPNIGDIPLIFNTKDTCQPGILLADNGSTIIGTFDIVCTAKGKLYICNFQIHNTDYTYFKYLKGTILVPIEPEWIDF